MASQAVTEHGGSLQDLLPLIFDGEDIRGRHWTDFELKWLHSELLEASLDILTRNSSEDDKRSVIHWIFAADITRTFNTQGQAVAHEYAEQRPLSFVACCKVSGMNPETIREGVVYALRKSNQSHFIPREWR